VAVNRFHSDTPAELALVVEAAEALGARAHVCTHWADGGAGAIALAETVVETAERGEARFAPLYPDDLPLLDKIHVVARDIYGAGELLAPQQVVNRLAEMESQGFGQLPVCMAKTAYSFSADPQLRGAPSGHAFPVREVRLSAGAEFVVAICGDVMTMPGLPRRPSAEHIHVGADGVITGLA
jgi:formate--tetrahydrofolate ligase